MNLAFSTNAYTGASGQFSVALNIPAAVGSEAYSFAVMEVANTVFTGFVGGEMLGTSNFYLDESFSGAARTVFGTTNIPASISNIGIYDTCHYRVR